MPELSVQIIRFVDDYQPGIVETELIDAEGSVHRFIEKLPYFSDAALWASSEYPQPGAIPCQIVLNWVDGAGRSLVQVSTLSPLDIESTDGCSKFVVLTAQVQL